MKTILLVLFFLVSFTTISLSQHTVREEALIRRVFIDITGVVPVVSEVEWYIVYNKNGYIHAIDDLLDTHPNIWGMNKEECKKFLLSDDYIYQQPAIFDLNRSILYVTGENVECKDIQTLEHAKNKLLHHALLNSNNFLETVDYICNILMSRETTASEANNLTAIYNNIIKKYGEHAAWLYTLDAILKLKDVCTK